MWIAVRNIELMLCKISFLFHKVLDDGVTFELPDVDGFGEIFLQAKLDGFKNKLDGVLLNTIVPGNFRVRKEIP